jgi:general nucleoside transport system permease protein
MATLTVRPATTASVVSGFWTRARRAGATYAGLGLIAAATFGGLAKTGQDARFTFTEGITGLSVPIPARAGAIGFAVLSLLAGLALLSGRLDRWFWPISGVALAGLVASFLCWQVQGNVMPLGNVARLTVQAAIPLVFGAMAGVLCERSAVINVAIEGQLLIGAFLGALFGTIAGSIWAGLLAAAVGGLLVGGLLAVLAIRYLVNQVVLGVVLNLLVLGLTNFLYTQVLQKNQDRYNDSPLFSTWNIPLLSKIPVVGPALFEGNFFIYLAIVLVAGLHIGLFHTRWGLRTRAVGEHPTAADTVGIRVLATRYRNVMLAGVVAGIGGAYLTMGNQINSFTGNMTSGKGFIALAALIFGRWSPIGATLAALLFGFFGAVSSFLGLTQSQIPTQFLAMLPYLVTIIAVAGVVGRVRAPAADGQPYLKG